eukprot:2413485-Amphidinium_carterae.1
MVNNTNSNLYRDDVTRNLHTPHEVHASHGRGINSGSSGPSASLVLIQSLCWHQFCGRRGLPGTLRSFVVDAETVALSKRCREWSQWPGNTRHLLAVAGPRAAMIGSPLHCTS